MLNTAAPTASSALLNRVAGESTTPTAESEIRSEDHRAAFVALGNDLEEEVEQDGMARINESQSAVYLNAVSNRPTLSNTLRRKTQLCG